MNTPLVGNTPSHASDELLFRLMALHPKVFDGPPGPQGDRANLALYRIERLLAALGNPHQALPPTIHVAGTKGKGSTVAFLKSILEAGGLSVHAYTSPHLVKFHERIQIRGRPISEMMLVEVLNETEKANGGEPITFFEITNSAAFLAFTRTPADFCLLEVGLGGRLDSTNIVPTTACSIITPLGLDHMEFLGETIEEIAFAKSGILRAGTPAVIARQPDKAMAVIRAEAAKVGAPLCIMGEDFDAHEEHGRMVFQDENGLLDLPLPRLPGQHQIVNTALAIAALRLLQPDNLSDAAFAQGLRRVSWPARLQRLSRGPLIDLAPEGADVWLDGAHNAMAAEAIAHAMSEMEEKNPRPLTLILGMLKSKDAAGFLAMFKGLARRVITVPMGSVESGATAGALYDIAVAQGMEARPATDLEEAMAFATEMAEDDEPVYSPPRVLICGSLYLAGEVLKDNQ